MGSKYPILPPQKIITVLCKFGFEKTSQKGSHIKYIKAGITLEEFLKHLWFICEPFTYNEWSPCFLLFPLAYLRISINVSCLQRPWTGHMRDTPWRCSHPVKQYGALTSYSNSSRPCGDALLSLVWRPLVQKLPWWATP